MMLLTTIFIFITFITTDLFAITQSIDQPHTLSTPDTADIRDIKDIIAMPDVIFQWYLLGGTIVLLLLLAVLLYYLKKNRKEQEKLQAHEKALKALASARLLMVSDQSREFAICMANILRQYIEDRFHLFLQNLTTREFLFWLMDNPTDIHPVLQNHDKMLRDWLNHCDLVKFARYSLTMNEMEQMYSSVNDFITSTQLGDDCQ